MFSRTCAKGLCLKRIILSLNAKLLNFIESNGYMRRCLLMEKLAKIVSQP